VPPSTMSARRRFTRSFAGCSEFVGSMTTSTP
jgi:hypothetical protein